MTDQDPGEFWALLDDEARERGARWQTAKLWHWVDAVAWIHSQCPRLMDLLAGYRDFKDRFHSIPVGEGACRTVLRMHIADEHLERAERKLKTWCQDGAIEALAIASRTVVPLLDWHAGCEPIADGMPHVLIPADGLRGLCPSLQETRDHDADSEIIDRATRDAECRRIAAILDSDGVKVRDVRQRHIAEKWSKHLGKPVKVGMITGFMNGGGKGGRPSKSKLSG